MRGRVLSTSPSRIGGATMVLRDDGSLLLLAHCREHLYDQGRFGIHKVIPRDRGETWTARRPLLAAPDRASVVRALIHFVSADALCCYAERHPVRSVLLLPNRPPRP
jgi:hypothetical protein